MTPAESATARNTFQEWLQKRRATVDEALRGHLAEVKSQIGPHSRLADAVLYSVQVGGKRLRPILTLESCVACGGALAAALPAAIAIELIHTFSLIHDDLPAMDDDDLRRGEPTNHKVFGEGIAVLAGDWLATHALGMLTAGAIPGPRAARLVNALAAGTEAMIAGQGADMDGEQRPTDADLVAYIHQHKTAALLETSCRLGALSAETPDEQLTALARYGRHLGLAFQITDDLLDVTSTVEVMGKQVGKDADASKQTYPAAHGIEASRRQATAEIDAALAALSAFDQRADRLRDLARYVLQRTN
jgi:geranylgeranyl diphosphate synthase type II